MSHSFQLLAVISLGVFSGAIVPQRAVADEPAGDTDLFLGALSTADAGQFVADYKAALSKIDAYFSEITLIGTLDSVASNPPMGEVRETATFIFKRAGGASKYERATGGTTEVWCRNPGRYVFGLSESSANAGFLLSAVQPKNAPVSDSNERYAYRCLDASHAVMGVYVSSIIASPSFRLTRVERLQGQKEQLVHMVYRYFPDDGANLRDDELWISPERGFAIVKSRTDVKYPSESSTHSLLTEVEYGSPGDGVWIPARVSIRHAIRNYTSKEEFVLESYEHARAPEAEFTLSRYGLSEVDPSTSQLIDLSGKRRSWWFLGANAVALLLLVITFVIRKRIVRGRTRSIVARSEDSAEA